MKIILQDRLFNFNKIKYTLKNPRVGLKLELYITLMKSFVTGLLDLLFPPICVCCDTKLVQGETLICTICFSSFPETGAHTSAENAVIDRLIGKASVTHGLALYRLRKKSLLERALFAMKYKNQPKIGELFGQQYGSILYNAPITSTIDGIVPIPLHKKN
ncbi:hypothetical protein [Cardinium endosymbiont of Tipula unca]|uniref:ComF family protein n=1 Tax=Cardinium endosymbiont of Tipula unca TaxID=3066216 RepID=UPI0030CEF62E